MTKTVWVWPVSILFSSLIAALIVFVFPEIVIRPVVIMGFLFVCPGAMLMRFLQVKEIAVEWMLALALSFSLDAIVAGLQLYARIWSPTGTFSILLGLCVIGAFMQIAMLASPLIPFPRWTRILSLDTPGAFIPIILTLLLGSLAGIGFWLCILTRGIHI